MRKKKKYKLTPGHYFFDIKMGYQNTILISRETKEEAIYAYSNYVKQRKEVTWLGQWDGKKFIEDNENNLAA